MVQYVLVLMYELLPQTLATLLVRSSVIFFNKTTRRRNDASFVNWIVSNNNYMANARTITPTSRAVTLATNRESVLLYNRTIFHCDCKNTNAKNQREKQRGDITEMRLIFNTFDIFYFSRCSPHLSLTRPLLSSLI